MIYHRTRGLQNLVVLCQGIAAIELYWLVFFAFEFLRNNSAEEFHTRYVLYCFAILGGLALEAINRDRVGTRHLLVQRGYIRKLGISFRQTLFAVGVLLIMLAMMKDTAISRLFLVTFSGLLYLLLVVTNAVLPAVLMRRVFRGIRTDNTLLIGKRNNAIRLTDWLRGKEQFGLHTVGLIATDGEPEKEIGNWQLLGGLGDLEQITAEHHVKQVILLELPRDAEAHRRLLASCERSGIRLLILSDLEEMLHHPVLHLEDEGFRFIALREEPLENPLNRLLKRLLDVAVSVSLLAVLMPPAMLMVWICQRWQSPGPLLYRQPRTGFQNEPFRIIKFRTMHVENDDPARQATADDPRIYPAARWFRRYSIDEIPQLINVARGEMSLVGPRPHLLEHNRRFAESMLGYQIRTLVKPGMTGLAQVRGFRGEARSAEDINQRVRSDIEYLENWSLPLDLGILTRTALKVIFPDRSAF